MKRNKIVAAALVVLMMAGALVLASCSNCPGSGECKNEQKTETYGYDIDGTPFTDTYWDSDNCTKYAKQSQDADSIKTAARCAVVRSPEDGKAECDC